ncbi:hydrogenase maturation protease [Sphingobacteriales bacterium UPWRP_1]|nr:hydrogenase maturation protease [Sphingobacteriales bacterium TSM_CSS]PSJ77598.1 hydrogenase maturation protease [Sphingobacteriales bacterium UPWRP_1]
MPANEPSILVMGIGNYLMGDEGVGVHLAQLLEKENLLPKGVDVLDGGTGGFHLLGYFEKYDVVILIDATLDNDYEPGTIRLLKPFFSSDFPRALSTHDIGLKDVVETLILLNQMPEIYLFAVCINSVQHQRTTLSAAVEKAIPDLVRQIYGLIATLK